MLGSNIIVVSCNDAFIRFVDSICIGMCYVIVSTYDTTIYSHIINYNDTSTFCIHVMHNITYDTPIVVSFIVHDTYHMAMLAHIIQIIINLI